MGKKAAIFIIVGVVLGIALAGGGVYFLMQNGEVKPEEVNSEEVVEEYDSSKGKRLTLEKVQIPLASAGSKTSYLQADFTIIFKSEDALKKANEMVPDIKAAIYGVFETKTADELRVKPSEPSDSSDKTVTISPRESMRGPVLEAIRSLYLTEEDKDNVYSVVISSFLIG